MNRYVAALAAGSLLGVLIGASFFMLQLEFTDGCSQCLPPKGIHKWLTA